MIEVKHLSKMYGSNIAIQELNFTVKPGEIIGFLGPNGAGKTTTMRILAGYIPATRGTALIGGYDVHEQSYDVRRRIGYLPENPPLYLDMTIEEFLHFVAKIKGVPSSDRRTKVKSALSRCQLEDKQKVIIRKLSKGYRQRVGIAQAIVHDPPAIILDEPTVGLDPRQIIEVRNLIKSLKGDHTIIISTHILPEVSMTCDRVIIINQGKVVATNTPDNLMKQMKTTFDYCIEVEGDISQIPTKLAKIPDISLVEMKPHNHRYLLNITCQSNCEPGGEIANVLVQEGIKLYEMRRTKPTLEDVFLQLTTQETSVDP